MLTEDEITRILAEAGCRFTAARNAGGISERDRREGATVPVGWSLDILTLYWIPPNVELLPGR